MVRRGSTLIHWPAAMEMVTRIAQMAAVAGGQARGPSPRERTEDADGQGENVRRQNARLAARP